MIGTETGGSGNLLTDLTTIIVAIIGVTGPLVVVIVVGRQRSRERAEDREQRLKDRAEDRAYAEKLVREQKPRRR